MKKSILIVDDDQDILKIISYLLVESGYEIATLQNGHQIFETITGLHPDLVLIDVMLEDMDGREICATMKCNMRMRAPGDIDLGYA